MPLSDSRPKVGLLLIACQRFRNLGTGTARGVYHERVQATANRMAGSLGQEMDVCSPGLVYDRGDLQRAIAGFQAAEVDFVLAEFLSWSEDAQWIAFLRDSMPCPVLFVHTVPDQIDFFHSASEDDYIQRMASCGLVGALEGSGAIPRIGGRYVVPIVGNREKVLREASRFGRAARARRLLRRAAVGLLGNYNEVMWSTYVDPYNVFSRLGPTLHFISYSDLAEEIAAVPREEVAEYVGQLRSQHAVMPEVDELPFSASACASLAIARIAARMDLDVVAINDVDHALLRAIGLRPGFYPPWFNARGSVLVPEGDVGGGLAAYLLKIVSGKHVNYIEPGYIVAEAGAFAGMHGGPNDYTDPTAADRVIIASDVRFAKANYKHSGAPFAWYRITAGEKTMVHLSESNGRFKLVCAMVDSLDGQHFLSGTSHGLFRPRVPVDRFFEQLLRIGVTQHSVVADGDWRKPLGDLCAMAGLDYYEVGRPAETVLS